jgi:hypothetical protein
VEVICFYQKNDITVVQAGFHAGTCDLQDREDQRGNKGGNSRNDDQGV